MLQDLLMSIAEKCISTEFIAAGKDPENFFFFVDWIVQNSSFFIYFLPVVLQYIGYSILSPLSLLFKPLFKFALIFSSLQPNFQLSKESSSPWGVSAAKHCMASAEILICNKLLGLIDASTNVINVRALQPIGAKDPISDSISLALTGGRQPKTLAITKALFTSLVLLAKTCQTNQENYNGRFIGLPSDATHSLEKIKANVETNLPDRSPTTYSEKEIAFLWDDIKNRATKKAASDVATSVLQLSSKEDKDMSDPYFEDKLLQVPSLYPLRTKILKKNLMAITEKEPTSLFGKIYHMPSKMNRYVNKCLLNMSPMGFSKVTSYALDANANQYISDVNDVASLQMIVTDLLSLRHKNNFDFLGNPIHTSGFMESAIFLFGTIACGLLRCIKGTSLGEVSAKNLAFESILFFLSGTLNYFAAIM